MKPERKTIKGSIENVFYANPRYSAGLLRQEDGQFTMFAGNLYAKKGEPVSLFGHYYNHPRYGFQFKVLSMVLDLNLDAKGLANYLAKNPEFEGIGPKRAEQIANRFEKDFEEALLNRPEVIAHEIGVSLPVIENLKTTWEKNRAINNVAVKLASFELTHFQISQLVDRLGASAVNVLEDNPYLLIECLPKFGFKRVDKIARKLGIPKNLPARIQAGLMHHVQALENYGHCWIEFADLGREAIALLMMDDPNSDELIDKQINEMIAEDKLVGVHIPDESPYTLVGIAGLYKKETELAEIFSKAWKPNPLLPVLGNIERLVDLHAPSLNEQQRESAITALSHSISLISGPGGAGKSYTIAAIAEIIEAQGKSVVLVAPTGKAAKRLEQLGDRPAQTIHRLLGFNGSTFKHDRSNPVSGDVIIADEVSICSSALLWHLLTSIDLSKTSVILVGDHNQLPPVGAGNPLRDLIQSKAIPTVVLTQCVRQAGALKENSTAILNGEVRRTTEEVNQNQKIPWHVIDGLSRPIDVKQYIIGLFEKALERLGYDLVRDVQVLVPTKMGDIGTRALNIAIQRALQKKLHNVDVAPVKEEKKPRIYLHDKVIQTRNNYNLGVMNGAVGAVVDLDSKFMVVDFDGKQVEIARNTNATDDLMLAYATTIHKYQGSEIPCAIVVVHRSHAFMHHRNLLYTGVTRAKEMAVIVGDHVGIRNCAKTTQVDERNTFLSLLLQECGRR